MKGKKQINSVLGIAFDGRKVSGGVVRRVRDGVRFERAGSFELSLDPLSGDPELTGREVRQHLDQSGLSEKQCVVGLPLEWALTSLVRLPELEGEHLDGFLRIQMEKAFPFLPEDLAVSTSRVSLGEGERYALLTAVPRKHIDLLERSLRAAGLHPVSFSLGIQALSQTGAASEDPALSLVVDGDGVSVAVTVRDGVIALRSLNDAFLVDEPGLVFNGPALVRELRVTLGKLPERVRAELKRIRIRGPARLARALAAEIEPRAQVLGMRVEVVSDLELNGAAVTLPFTGGVPAALALGARHLHRQPGGLEYLPPRISPFEKLVRRVNSRRTGLLVGTAAALALLTMAAFAWQSITLSRLQNRWSGMEERVVGAERTQADIRTFRSWHDVSQPSLRVLKALTLAFPEDGRVTAKSLELGNASEVSCSGTAATSAALFETLDRLRANPNVKGLQTENLRGQRDVQFSFTFRWEEGGAHVE